MGVMEENVCMSISVPNLYIIVWIVTGVCIQNTKDTRNYMTQTPQLGLLLGDRNYPLTRKQIQEGIPAVLHIQFN